MSLAQLWHSKDPPNDTQFLAFVSSSHVGLDDAVTVLDVDIGKDVVINVVVGADAVVSLPPPEGHAPDVSPTQASSSHNVKESGQEFPKSNE